MLAPRTCRVLLLSLPAWLRLCRRVRWEPFIMSANRLLERRLVLVPNDFRNSRKTNIAGRGSVDTKFYG